MSNENKTKTEERIEKVKGFVEDHALGITYGIGALACAGIIIAGKKHDKKFEKMWRAAKTALDNGDKDYNYGPYKLAKFFDPNTDEFLGQLPIHETAVESFLKLK